MKRLIPCLLLLVLFSAARAQTTNPPNQISETTRVNTNSSHDFKFTVYEPAAGALTAALAGAGAGNVENGAHRYKVTFVTAQGQSVAGTASGAVTVVDKTANGKVSLSAIPTGSVFVTSRKVYRTVAGGTVYKLLTTIADNTTTTFTDNVADASLTTTAPTANTTANPWLTTDADTGVTTVYKLTIGSGGCSGCGTPGGSDTQVQFNDSSAFGGDAGLTYNKTTDTLTTVTFVGALTGTASGNLVSGGAAGTPSSIGLANGTGLPATGGGTGQSTYTKGDLLASPGSNTLNKLAVGTDGQVLTADAASTNGVKWAAAGGGGANTVTTSLMLSSTTVDLNEGTAAKQPLYTCPASRRCIVTNIVMQKFSANGTAFIVQAGWNAPAGDVLLSNAFGIADGYPSTTQSFNGVITSIDNGQALSKFSVIGVAADVLGLVVSTPEGSALTAKVDVYGYLTDTSGVPIANVNGTGDGVAIAPASITGTTTNGNAPSGAVGEYVESLIASGSATSLTTATAKNVTSISLTAGDWDVSGNINFSATTATVTGTQGGIFTTSATLPTDGSEVFSGVQVTLISESDSVTLPRKRISIAATTTVYLVAKSTFSAGSVSAFGQINARRVR